MKFIKIYDTTTKDYIYLNTEKIEYFENGSTPENDKAKTCIVTEQSFIYTDEPMEDLYQRLMLDDVNKPIEEHIASLIKKEENKQSKINEQKVLAEWKQFKKESSNKDVFSLPKDEQKEFINKKGYYALVIPKILGLKD